MNKNSDSALSLNTYNFLRFIFIINIAVLIIFGLLMLFSATYTPALAKNDSQPYSEIIQQTIFALVGVLIATIIASYAPNTRLSKHALISLITVGFAVALVSTALTLFIGIEINGSKRWLNVFGIQFQPSEVLKLALAMTLSVIIVFMITKSKAPFFKYFRYGFVLLLVFSCLAITVLQPDLGTSSVLFATGCLALLFGGIRKRVLLLLIFLIFILGLIAINLPNRHFAYARERIEAWVNPEENSTTTGYQYIQSQLSIANGGIYGKGFLKSEGKLGRLPFHDTDFIYSVIVEELGLIGGGVLLLLYLLLSFLGYLLSVNAPSRIGKEMGPVLCGMITIQALVHILTNLQLIPATGITLPFFSNGGSSLIVTLVTLGVFMRATRRIV